MSGFDLLRSLPWGPIWTVTKAVADLGLVVFAAVQLWLLGQARRDRLRTALTIVFADQARLRVRLYDWEAEDLVAAAKAGKFFHEGIAPPDWGLVMQSLGELGPEVAGLGTTAYALLNQVIRSARLLAETKGVGTPAAPGSELETHCRTVLDEVLKTLDDAMSVAPRGLSATQFTLSDPTSAAGKEIERAFRENLKHASVPAGFWATRLGRVLSAVGQAFVP